MFVLSEHIDNLNIGIDISYKSNTMLDRNWQWIGRERWIGSLVVKAVVLKFTHPDASFGQYTFVLSISTFDKKPLISGTSNNILDRNRHQIGWEINKLEFRLLQHWSSVHSKHRDFTNLPDDQFDQYMFILRISPFAMTVLLSWTSNTMLDRNRP